MRVLNITNNDWANFGYNNMMALRAAGVDAGGYKFRPHGFSYDNEMNIVDESGIISKIKEADIVQVIHSDFYTWLLCCGKKKIVYHTGTGYRQAPEHCNEYFNPTAEFCFTDQTEFMNLGAKGIRYMTTAIDVNRIYPKKKISGKIKIGHFPSKTKANLKGTTEILNMLFEAKILYDKSDRFEIITDLKSLPHEEHLGRMQSCDIYVELFAPEQSGKPYGCYGVTAFEAAAMGKIVITQNLNAKVYADEYGGTELLYGNTRELFMSICEILMNMSTEELAIRQEATRQWCVDKHSYLAIGNKLAGYLNQINY